MTTTTQLPTGTRVQFKGDNSRYYVLGYEADGRVRLVSTMSNAAFLVGEDSVLHRNPADLIVSTPTKTGLLGAWATYEANGVRVERTEEAVIAGKAQEKRDRRKGWR